MYCIYIISSKARAASTTMGSPLSASRRSAFLTCLHKESENVSACWVMHCQCVLLFLWLLTFTSTSLSFGHSRTKSKAQQHSMDDSCVTPRPYSGQACDCLELEKQMTECSMLCMIHASFVQSSVALLVLQTEWVKIVYLEPNKLACLVHISAFLHQLNERCQQMLLRCL